MSAIARALVIASVCLLMSNVPMPLTAAEKMAAPVVAVIDFQRIARESKAGEAVRNQVGLQHTAFQSEIKQLQADLEVDRADIRQKQEKLSKEEFEELGKRYQGKAEKLQKMVQQRKQQLDQMYVDGMRKVEVELVDVVRKIASERGINLILNAAKGQGIVLYADQSTVITDEARARLDQRLPSLTLIPPGNASDESSNNTGSKSGKSKE